ncbi:Hypothetical predicted protein, partial [Paramuricea clavata]
MVQNDCNTNKQSTWSWNVVKNHKPNQNESTQRGQNSGQNSHNGLAKTDNPQYSVLVDESDDEILTYYLKVNYLSGIKINLNHPDTPSGPMKTKDVTILRLENNKQTTTEITTTTSEPKILADLRESA